jgi:hypothetical protein
MLAAAKFIGAGLACSGLIGAGLGIGQQFTCKYFVYIFKIIH